MFTEQQAQQLKIDFKFWRLAEKIAGRPYPVDDEESFRLLAARSAQYGSLAGARSAWTRAAKELADDGIIRLKKPTPPPQAIPADFQAQIDAMSSTQLRERLSKDQAFADLFGRFSAGEKPEGVIESDDPYANLTKLQWRALPPVTAARLMSSPRFRAAVDRLIAKGEI